MLVQVLSELLHFAKPLTIFSNAAVELSYSAESEDYLNWLVVDYAGISLCGLLSWRRIRYANVSVIGL